VLPIHEWCNPPGKQKRQKNMIYFFLLDIFFVEIYCFIRTALWRRDGSVVVSVHSPAAVVAVASEV